MSQDGERDDGPHLRVLRPDTDTGEPVEAREVGPYQLEAGEPAAFDGAVAAAVEDDPRTWEEILEQDGPQDRGLLVLVDLVKTGSVDPWDVDLKVVAARFLEAVDALTIEDLPKSGRLIFYASVIIRMKAQWLAGQGADMLAEPEEGLEDEYWDEWGDDAWDEDVDADALIATGRRRRLPGDILLFPKERVPKRRPLTIQDLLEALDKAELHEDKMERMRARRKSGKGPVVPFKTVKEAMDTVHQDDFERDILAAKGILGKVLTGEDSVVGLDVFDGTLDRISAFLALLFLAAKGEVDIDQEEFYTPIRVKKGDPESIKRIFEARPRFVPKKRKKKKAKKAEGEAAEDEVLDEVAADAGAEGDDPDARSAEGEQGAPEGAAVPAVATGTDGVPLQIQPSEDIEKEDG